jgi:alpha-tubulin suppressor-like RCC1 family protein
MLMPLFISVVQSVWAVQPKVSGGAYHSLSLKTDRRLWAWGITVMVAVKSPDRQRD